MKATSKVVVSIALAAAAVPFASRVSAQPIPDNPPATGETLPRELTLSSPEIVMSLAILGMGAIVMLFVYMLVRTEKLSSDGILKVTAVPLIIISAVFLVTAGYSTNQLVSVIGLLGTIAGYLLGAAKGGGATKAGGQDAK